MAKLRISAEYMRERLFDGETPPLVIHGASYDPISDCILLDVSGPAIPNDAEEVVCSITTRQTTYNFTVRK